MTPEIVVQLARETLFTALLLATPILAMATVVSLVINIGQVMTSIQEHTVATVPRIAVVAVTAYVMLPWMLRKLMSYTVQLFSNFHHYLG
jgi:flagellar biosynthetic protein FliQ